MTTQSITTLILGTAPENATPATHILAGPWCTAPASAEETGFDMPPEPLADPERLETAARQARQLVTQLAPRLRDYLNELYGTQHDDRYWDFVLAPWLVRAVETLIDRLYRAAGILETFGGRPLSVPVLDASEFAFADTQDFIMGGILNPQWNHWLFSRLLKRDWPAAWTAEELPPVRREAAPTRRENLLKHVARNILFSLPDPENLSAFESAVRRETEALLDVIRSSGCRWVVVSGETGLGGIEPTRLGRNYCDGLGLANQLIAAQAREAFLIVAGRLLKLEE